MQSFGKIFFTERESSGGHLACRRAGLPSPAKRSVAEENNATLMRTTGASTPFPGGRDATLYVRQEA